ncbi:putative pilus assembly protein [Francisella philomiragia]|uniref:hypothetical protein n=1 Tax=Francisella philomiragia TaxID=28110 RepID=UPI0005A564CC|nr:hypothetical protein [Francisella philomiragia]AJI55183.1 putative pilus assembly protein [Francisella philomiragia]MBK2253194.1 hypothetical protein [Francisella philomiragia]
MLKLKSVLLISIFILASNLVYAINCQLIDSQSGYKGFLEFSCDTDISLDDNKAIFYLIGNNVDIKSLDVSDANIKYSIDTIAENIKRVNLNISKKTLFVDLDYTANKDKPIKIAITAKKDTNLEYKVLWGGVVNSSNKIQKNNNNNLQFYRTRSRELFAVKDGLGCTIKADCDDKISLLNQDGLQMSKLDRGISGYLSFGIIHEKLV